MRKIILGLCCLLVLTACEKGQLKSENNYENPTIAELPMADISGYRNLKANPLVKKGSLRLVLDIYQEGGAMVFYVGMSSCVNCLEFFPVLLEVATEYNIPVVYVDARLEPHPETNPDYFEFLQVFSDFLDVDEEGNKDIFMPYTVFAKDGKVLAYYIGGAENYDPIADGPMSEKQIKSVKKDLYKGFDKVGK